jgi:D-aminopeptidase
MDPKRWHRIGFLVLASLAATLALAGGAPPAKPRAPLLAHQLKRAAHRVTLGLGRNGSISGNDSGDIFIAFSTANSRAAAAGPVGDLQMLPNDSLDPVFRATVEATEEAIVNAMVAAEDMTGVDDHRVIAIPHEALRAVLRKYGRLAR